MNKIFKIKKTTHYKQTDFKLEEVVTNQCNTKKEKNEKKKKHLHLQQIQQQQQNEPRNSNERNLNILNILL